MQRRIHDTLAEEFDSYRVVGRRHDVPPHEVYEVTVDGRRAAVKYDTGPTGSAGTEGRVLAFVDRVTSVPVPTVLRSGPDSFVAEWHPDAPDPEGTALPMEDWAAAAGRGLATLHADTAPSIDAYGRFRPPTDESTGAGADRGIAVDGSDDWHAVAMDYVRRHRPVLARYGHADVVDRILAFLAAHPAVFDGVGDPVCCHGWATPEHVAVADGGVTCVLDFEHAVAAPGEFDYWRTVLPAFGPGGDGEEAFRAGYESVRSLPAGFERRSQCYVLLNEVYYFESLYVQDQHGRTETAERASRLRERVDDRLDRLERDRRNA